MFSITSECRGISQVAELVDADSYLRELKDGVNPTNIQVRILS